MKITKAKKSISHIRVALESFLLSVVVLLLFSLLWLLPFERVLFAWVSGYCTIDPESLCVITDEFMQKIYLAGLFAILYVVALAVLLIWMKRHRYKNNTSFLNITIWLPGLLIPIFIGLKVVLIFMF